MIKMCCVTKLAFFFLIFFTACKGSNILLLNGVPSKSHFIWSRPIINALAAHGHNLTVLSVDIDENPRLSSNKHYISLEEVYSTLYDTANDLPKNDISKRSEENAFQSILSFYNFGYLACKGAVKSNGFKQLLSYPADFQFDLVIYDFTVGPCLLGFLHHYNTPPLIAITAFGIPQFTHNLIPSTKSYSTVPHFALAYDGNKMSFDQRIMNFVVHSFDQFYRNYIYLPRLHKLIQPLFPQPLPNLGDIELKTRIMLTNSNPNVDDFGESLPQSVIPVGGLQIARPKNLSHELQSFVDKSKNGFVLFSLGTNVKKSVLGKQRFEMFHTALRQIGDYNFIWKLDGHDDDLESNNLNTNVKIVKWLPQTDLLGHSKIEAFITHCGLLSLHEAYWYGVPIIGIPVYVDQHRNCFKAELDGVGTKLDFNQLEIDTIRDTILEVLGNNTYKEIMKAKSKLFRDQKELPLARAIWWIEWVLRHPIDKNYSPPNFGFFQSHSYDVVLILISTIIGAVFFLWIVFRRMANLLTRVKKEQKPIEKMD